MNLSELNITEVERAITVVSDKGTSINIENRKTYGLSLCYDGEITYTHNGKSFVQDKNHVVILPQGKTYSLHFNKSGSFPVIDFVSDNLNADTIKVIPIDSQAALLTDYEKMKSLFLFGNNRLKILSLFYGILGKLTDTNNKDSLLLPAFKYIEDHFSESDLSVSEAALRCNISEAYLRRRFKKSTGLSPKEYIMEIRLSKARQLLAEGQIKIGSVAEECGFNSQYHFCRIFRQKTGITPTEYTKENKIWKI